MAHPPVAPCIAKLEVLTRTTFASRDGVHAPAKTRSQPFRPPAAQGASCSACLRRQGTRSARFIAAASPLLCQSAMTNATAICIDVLRVLTIISSMMVRLSPWPDFYRVHKRRSTGEVNILPVALLFTLCYLLTIYAYMIGNFFPLFTVAVLGLFTSSGFFGVYYRWSRDRAYLHKLIAIITVVLLIASIYTALAMSGATNQSSDTVATIMGWVTNVPGLGLCIAPLTTIKKVVQTKSSASLPFTMCVVLLVNSVFWIAYSSLDYNFIILFPNIVGCVLSSVQVTLCFVYPSKLPVESSKADERISVSIYPIALSPHGNSENASDRGSYDHKLSVYRALQSPVTIAASEPTIQSNS